MISDTRIPSWAEVLHHSIRQENLIIHFNYDLKCKVDFHRLPDLVNNHQELKGDDRVNIDLLIDWIINFVYLPILETNNFQSPPPIKDIYYEPN